MNEDTKDTNATEQAEPAAAEPQNEPAQPSALTAEEVSRMIADAVSGLEQRQSEAKKLAEMTDQQRAETERDRYKQQLEDLQKQVDAAQMQQTARGILAEKGIHLPDSLLAQIVTTDAKTTKEQVEAFSKLFTQAVEEAVKERLKGEPPKRGTSSGMTKEQIFAIKDDAARIKAINENMNLFV